MKNIFKTKKVIIVLMLSNLLFYTSCLGDIADSTEEKANLYYNLGNAYSDLQRFDDAVEMYSNAYQLDDNFKAAGYNLVRVYISLDKFEEAEELLLSMIKEESANIILLETAGFLYHKWKNYEEALRFYNRVLVLDVLNSNALYNTFLILKNIENSQGALRQLIKYIEINEEDFLAYISLAELYLASDEKNSAVDAYKLFLKNEIKDEDKILEIQIALALLYKELELYSDSLEILKTLTDLGEDEQPSANLLFEKAWVLLIGIEEYEEGLDVLLLAIDAGFADKKLATQMGVIEKALYHDEIVVFLKEHDLFDPALLIVPEETEETEKVLQDEIEETEIKKETEPEVETEVAEESLSEEVKKESPVEENNSTSN